MTCLSYLNKFGRYKNPDFQKWYLDEIKRQNVKFGEYDLPDAYSDWLENFPNRKPFKVTKK